MAQDVLAIAGAITQAAKHGDYRFGNVGEIGFLDSIATNTKQLFIHFLGGLGDQLLDPSRVNAAVLHESLQGHAGDFTADRIKAADHDNPGGIVDDDIDARGLFEAAYIAALPADDASFHIVAGDGHGADGVV